MHSSHIARLHDSGWRGMFMRVMNTPFVGTPHTLPVAEEVISVIAELTGGTKTSFSEQRARLRFSTVIRDQKWLLDAIRHRFGVWIYVNDEWKTTVGEVIQGMRPRR